ncbi:hypothetical protein [Nodosilinea sp. E11]|uniref:hypothetical protein n=1 Tax=Nodosilinea sp. E11 TaxID=3037479 RepID=UPI00293497ED|nr:hypothetical protein [Nodosilinea sp. E11]WOD37360.1 hypothetical protein RRF56_02480 [Nodosilinea sp. E11]
MHSLLATFFLATGSIALMGNFLPTQAQMFDSSMGYSRTSSCITQKTASSTTETYYNNTSGFAVAGENVSVVDQGGQITPSATFVIAQPAEQFSLGVDTFTPGIDRLIHSSQDTTIETVTRSFSVFQ